MVAGASTSGRSALAAPQAKQAAERVVQPPSRQAVDVQGDTLSVTGPDGERVYIKLDAPPPSPSGSSFRGPTRGAAPLSPSPRLAHCGGPTACCTGHGRAERDVVIPRAGWADGPW